MTFLDTEIHDKQLEFNFVQTCAWGDKGIADAADIVKPEMLYCVPYRVIYETALRLHDEGKAVFPTTIYSALGGDYREQYFPTQDKFLELLETDYYATGTLVTNAEKIKDYYRRRSITHSLLQAKIDINDTKIEIDETLKELDTRLTKIESNSKLFDMEAAFMTINERIQIAKQQGRAPGLSTGIQALDAILGPIEATDYVIVAAGTSIGKTALAGQITANVCRVGGTVLYMSGEMSEYEILMRLLSAESSITHTTLKHGRLTKQEEKAFQMAQARMTSDWKLIIEDMAARTPKDILRRAKRVRAELGQLDLIVIDYIDLMGCPNSKVTDIFQATTIKSNVLKQVAMQLGVPILCLVQLNRARAHRSDPKPKLSDLRNSGALEQDANKVVMIHRKHPKDLPTTIMVEKNRNGECGEFDCRYNPDYLIFEGGSHE